MNEIIKKAQNIIYDAQNNENFLSDNAEYLIATGERSVDYSLYEFELSENYFLFIDFVDFSFKDFSIINKSHKESLIYL